MQQSCPVVVLAAGLSSRMGGENKLLLPLDGQPVVRHTVTHAIDAGVGPVVVVTGHQREDIQNALADCFVQFLHNSAFKEGMATSVVAGVQYVACTADCCVVMLGDMPLISVGTVRRVVSSARESPAAAAVIPVFNAEWAHPVVLRRKIFPEILQLQGDTGARKILAGRGDVVLLPVEDEGTVLDADTPEAFAEIQRFYASRCVSPRG